MRSEGLDVRVFVRHQEEECVALCAIHQMYQGPTVTSIPGFQWSPGREAEWSPGREAAMVQAFNGSNASVDIACNWCVVQS